MNNFKNYFVDVVTQKYFQFSGRAPRREFWYIINRILFIILPLSMYNFDYCNRGIVILLLISNYNFFNRQ